MNSKLLVWAIFGLSSISFLGCDPVFQLQNYDPTVRMRISGEAQKFFQVLYEGMPMPPRILESEYQPLLAQLNARADAATITANLVKKYGTRDPMIWLYDRLDLDKDGGADWVHNEGRFYPRDKDIDGDGTPNIFDADPFNALVQNSDRDGDRLPDHLDWDYDGDGIAEHDSVTPEMAAIQSELFNEHGIVAVNQDARHNAATLIAFKDVLDLAFGSVLAANQNRFPGVSVLGAQQGEKDSPTLAWYQRLQEIITIEDLGRVQSKNPLFANQISIAFYGTVIHEIGHALHHYVNDLHLRAAPPESNYIEKRYLAKFWNGTRFSGKTQNEWMDTIVIEMDNVMEKARQANNPSLMDYFFDPAEKKILVSGTQVAAENHILTSYSLTAPEEYFAESVKAYVFKVMIEKRFADKPEPIRTRLQNKLSRYVLVEGGIRAENLPVEGFELLESVLHLNERLYWDPHAKRSDRFRGKWLIKP